MDESTQTWTDNAHDMQNTADALHDDLLRPGLYEAYPPSSCAVVAEGTAINHIANADVSLADYAGMLADRGTYDPASGTPLSEVGEFSRSLGLNAVQETDQSLADLQSARDHGMVPIVAVDSSELLASGPDHSIPDWFSDTLGSVGLGPGCDHVTLAAGVDGGSQGIDHVLISDPNFVAIDPIGSTEPARVDADQFEDAMRDCGGVVTYISDAASPHADSSVWHDPSPFGFVAPEEAARPLIDMDDPGHDIMQENWSDRGGVLNPPSSSYGFDGGAPAEGSFGSWAVDGSSVGTHVDTGTGWGFDGATSMVGDGSASFGDPNPASGLSQGADSETSAVSDNGDN